MNDVISRISAAVAGSGSRHERAQAAADLIRAATAQRWVGIYTVTATSVVNEAWSGPGPPAFRSFPRERGLTSHAVRTAAPALSNDVAGDPRYLENQDDSGSEVILPVLDDGRVLGTLDVESDRVGAFTGRVLADLEHYAQALSALWSQPVAPSRTRVASKAPYHTTRRG